MIAARQPTRDFFSPLQLIAMRYTNRPSGIPQVISFKK
jgi:hypothetical protein